MKNILITSKEFGQKNWDEIEMLLSRNDCHPIFNPYPRAMTAFDICEVNRQHRIDGIIVYSSSDEITREVFETCSNLKVVSRHGVGLENIDLQSATEFNVEVTTTRDNDDESVADLTFGLLLNVARRISEADRNLRSGCWRRLISTDVWGKTIGIIGLGRIGKAVARRAQGFKMKILFHDPYAESEFTLQENIQSCSLEKLLGESDFVTLHCVLNQETRGLIGRRELGLMKRSAYLINTARAGLVDQEALREALRNRFIAGAAVDVYPVEPATEDPLICEKFENLIATPHIGSYTAETLRRMDLLAVMNAIEVLKKYR